MMRSAPRSRSAAWATKAEADERGERLIWMDRAAVIDRLRFLRGTGESFSDVILALVESEGSGKQ